MFTPFPCCFFSTPPPPTFPRVSPGPASGKAGGGSAGHVAESPCSFRPGRSTHPNCVLLCVSPLNLGDASPKGKCSPKCAGYHDPHLPPRPGPQLRQLLVSKSPLLGGEQKGQESPQHRGAQPLASPARSATSLRAASAPATTGEQPAQQPLTGTHAILSRRL